ncbi:hypothetical protein amrb99_63310 [Actinomadura sp. RB99]|uniref:bifunctional DNA primase/polymerase n=1 Tax=Actinomadura sp. RB99 TaxID=2691577 RepID=UPI001686E028|nr:bifunctional DNA primase/polymerase [Actinomadura sp. RB99]MBD2897371.1 hypothetical protein [Actinomadura sp. RB99]
MSAPDVREVAEWLRSRHGLALFAVDHPALSQCAGAHRPDRPCDGKRGKHPCGRWSRDATNPGRLAAELRRGPRNLGIACGPSGLLVIDEDKPGAFTAYATENGHQVPGTFTVKTSKGAHFYFRQPAGSPVGNSAGALAGRGIDVRGAAGMGGYVVGPGSVHETGVLYEPVDSAASILPAPEWLVSALRSPRPMPQRAPNGAPAGRGHRMGARQFKVLTGLVQVVLDAQPGERNNALYWAACRVREHAEYGLFAASRGRAALLQAALRIGLPEAEAQRTLDSAERGARGGVA